MTIQWNTCASSLLATILAGCASQAGPQVTEADTPIVTQILRGTDRASVFSPSEAAFLKQSSGVAWTGVYIGGPCSAASGWSRQSVEAIFAATQWQFLPIYVGQQLGIGCRAATLTRAQGVADGQQAASQMVAFGWSGGQEIPVVLDLERPSFDQNQGGAADYTRGWLDAVHAAGYLGYVYSSFNAINAYAAQGLPIDAAWVALYPSGIGGFADVSPYDARTQLGGNFTTHNRAWQYKGSFATGGAGSVDADVSDLILAPAPGQSRLGNDGCT